jgi:hypothetical protein
MMREKLCAVNYLVNIERVALFRQSFSLRSFNRTDLGESELEEGGHEWISVSRAKPQRKLLRDQLTAVRR